MACSNADKPFKKGADSQNDFYHYTTVYMMVLNQCLVIILYGLKKKKKKENSTVLFVMYPRKISLTKIFLHKATQPQHL